MTFLRLLFSLYDDMIYIQPMRCTWKDWEGGGGPLPIEVSADQTQKDGATFSIQVPHSTLWMPACECGAHRWPEQQFNNLWVTADGM